MDNVTILKGDGSSYQTTKDWANKNATLLAKHGQVVKTETVEPQEDTTTDVYSPLVESEAENKEAESEEVKENVKPKRKK